MRKTHPPVDKRADILDATLALIARGGIDTVRYRDVADEAGVPLGTVQYHFTSRDALLDATFRHFLLKNAELLRGLGAKAPRKHLEDVGGFLYELLRIDFLDAERAFLAEYELILYAARHPELSELIVAWDRAMAHELAPALEALGVPQPTANARTLVEMLRGFQLVHLGRTWAELKDPLADFSRRVTSLLSSAAASAMASALSSAKGKHDGKTTTSR